MQELRMKYANYKTHYADCENLGDYDKGTKTITVLIPEGRMKPSGTRGQKFLFLRFSGVEIGTGRKVSVSVQAIDRAHAIAALNRDYNDVVWDV